MESGGHGFHQIAVLGRTLHTLHASHGKRLRTTFAIRAETSLKIDRLQFELQLSPSKPVKSGVALDRSRSIGSSLAQSKEASEPC